LSQLQHNLSQALDLSQKIYDLAQQTAWSEMELADRQRRILLESIFEDVELKQSPDLYQPMMQRILELNEQTLALCSAARVKLNKEGRSLNVGKQALSAYKKNSFD
jgi:hypothetical protein